MEKGAVSSLFGIQRQYIQCIGSWGVNLINWPQKNFNEENVSLGNKPSLGQDYDYSLLSGDRQLYPRRT